MTSYKILVNEAARTVVEFDDSKYRVEWDYSDPKHGKFVAYRGTDEVWRDLTGDNLVYWMLCAVVEANNLFPDTYNQLLESVDGAGRLRIKELLNAFDPEG